MLSKEQLMHARTNKEFLALTQISPLPSIEKSVEAETVRGRSNEIAWSTVQKLYEFEKELVVIIFLADLFRK